MNRAAFTTLLAGGAAGLPLWVRARDLEGTMTTQSELFRSLPRIASGDWTRIILGSGASYQKQIGAGVETAPNGSRLSYLEMQVGSPGGSCNPSSMRKAYLRERRFGSLFDTYALVANIGRTENLFYRFGDRSDDAHPSPADETLRLLDAGYLYDPRPLRVVSVARQTIHAASRDVDATHIVARFATATRTAQPRIKNIELWHNEAFPFGVVQYRATLDALDPFVAHVYSFGGQFKSLLPLTLAQVRKMTPNGQYGQLPQGIGS